MNTAPQELLKEYVQIQHFTSCKQSSKMGQMGVRTKTWTKLRWRYPHV